MTKIFSVSQLIRKLQENLAESFPWINVRGEISNLARPALSPHLYFDLKDKTALLHCVWFASSQKAVQADTSKLTNGLEALCSGVMAVYPPRGQYQLLVQFVQLHRQEGALSLELEKLKAELQQKGYFSLERKRRIPINPARVTILTAPTGAAIHDFLRIAEQRGAGATLRIHPISVQGADAPEYIARAIQEENKAAWAEVLVLIRGGGSFEDLLAFNTEKVADAIFASKIPVMAGIGHEIDTSFADMTADARAATPSHAAQLLWQERSLYLQQVDDLTYALQKNFAQRLDAATSALQQMEQALGHYAPDREFARKKEIFTRLDLDMHTAWQKRFDRAEEQLSRLEYRLAAHDPEIPLRKGYTLTLDAQGNFVRSVRNIRKGDNLCIRFRDGKIHTQVCTVCAGEQKC